MQKLTPSGLLAALKLACALALCSVKWLQQSGKGEWAKLWKRIVQADSSILLQVAGVSTSPEDLLELHECEPYTYGHLFAHLPFVPRVNCIPVLHAS
jgi:hypothetical protein